MRMRAIAVLVAGLIALPLQAADQDRWELPVTVQTLDNGLTVIVSPDHSAPTESARIGAGRACGHLQPVPPEPSARTKPIGPPPPVIGGNSPDLRERLARRAQSRQ